MKIPRLFFKDVTKHSKQIVFVIIASIVCTACQSGADTVLASRHNSTPMILIQSESGGGVPFIRKGNNPAKDYLSTSNDQAKTQSKVFPATEVGFLNPQKETTVAITPTITRSPPTPINPPVHYLAQSGDTLEVVARHYGIDPDEITSPFSIPETGLIDPGTLLILPPRSSIQFPHIVEMDVNHLMPDSEVVYGSSAAEFDVAQYLQESGGYLGKHREYLGSTAWTTSAEVVSRIALENSINPRLLLALMEYECGCVLGDSPGRLPDGIVMGVEPYMHRGLYRQLGWVANQLSAGYYGWRSGAVNEFPLPNGIILRPEPDSNAGSVALLNFFSGLAAQKAVQNIPYGLRDILSPIPVESDWVQALDQNFGFPALYQRMFGDPWLHDEISGPIFPARLEQPQLALPFEPGVVWSYTSGPHNAWQTEGAYAALDLAPAAKWSGCVPSNAWVTAVADGAIVRTGDGYVIQDLDDIEKNGNKITSDGKEQTGWSILYMHIASEHKVEPGNHLQKGDPIGHPSCEGGPATGTHLHIARKYNGEWIAADGPLPFNLNGWIAHAGMKPYEGTLTKGDKTVIAQPYGSLHTLIWYPDDEIPTYVQYLATPQVKTTLPEDDK